MLSYYFVVPFIAAPTALFSIGKRSVIRRCSRCVCQSHCGGQTGPTPIAVVVLNAISWLFTQSRKGILISYAPKIGFPEELTYQRQIADREDVMRSTSLKLSFIVFVSSAVLFSVPVVAQNVKDVTVINTPDVTVTNAPDVNVINTISNPVPTAPSFVREPFGFYDSGYFNPSTGSAAVTLYVPAGKRLVIEQVGVFARMLATDSFPRVVFYLNTNSVNTNYSVSLTTVPTSTTGLVDRIGIVPLRAYVDPGTSVLFLCSVFGSADLSNRRCEISVSGYLIDPASPSLSP